MRNKWNKKTMTYIHDTDDEITIKEIFQILVKRKVLFISTLIISFVLISAYLINIPKEYKFHQYIKPTSENLASAGSSASMLQEILHKTFTNTQTEIQNKTIKITIITIRDKAIKSIVDDAIKQIKKRYEDIIILKKKNNMKDIKLYELKINKYKLNIKLNLEKLKADKISINNLLTQIKLIESILLSSKNSGQITLLTGNIKILNSTIHSTTIENKMLFIKNEQNSEDIKTVQTTIDNLKKINASYINIKVISTLKSNKQPVKTTLKNIIFLLFSPLISFILLFSVEYYTNIRNS